MVTSSDVPVQRLLTPSKITAWLDCEHYLTLKHRVEVRALPRPAVPFGSFAQLLQEKGLEHEANVLTSYETAGFRIHTVDDRQGSETFAAWAERSLPHLDDDVELLFQMPFVHDRVRGIADFLERVVDSGSGEIRWEPVDAKLARSHAKPGHVLQLCFYAEALADATGTAPATLKISLGSGVDELIGYEDVRPYWTRLRVRLAEVLDAEPTEADTRPEPCDHCAFCEFSTVCNDTWRSEDSLVFVAGLRSSERAVLEAAGIRTRAALGERTDPVDGMTADRLERLRNQAALQVQADESPDAKPPFMLIEPSDDPMWGRGFELLPAPNLADVFLDFEGHPFWRADRGLFFLFGFISFDDGQWSYHQLWADDETSEGERVGELVRYLADRFAANPDMHVYHYNHTERSSLESLTAQHAVAESALADLVERGVFVDLLPIARNSVQVGVEGYGLKYLERLTDYERSHDIDKGAGAVVAFDQYQRDGDEAHRRAIAVYNEDDVRATMALRDWLVDQRPAGLAWRPAIDPPDPEADDVDELIEVLRAFGPKSGQYLLADLLSYWRRERLAYTAPIMAKLAKEADDLVGDSGVLTGLGHPEVVDGTTPAGNPSKWPNLRLTFCDQPFPRLFSGAKQQSAFFQPLGGGLVSVTVRALDVDAGTVDLVWNQHLQDLGHIPAALVPDEWVATKSKRERLVALANQLVDPKHHGEPNSVTLAMLNGDDPAFTTGGGPVGGVFTDDVEDLAAWVTELDQAVLAVQGPPGTGKTYRGAHMVKALVAAGKRVGIMAMSHHAIDNFLEEISKVFGHDPDVELRAVRRRDEPVGGGPPGVTYAGSNKALGDPHFNVVSGTSWQFAGKELQASMVDVLIIDEAGQLALIDAVVASTAARNVVLLGDPQQLPQVAQAVHPGRSGNSALGHILGADATMPATKGVFINESRRMHPDVCRFISDRIYEGRLSSHPDCARQGTDLGVGLRWLEVTHTGCSTESVEEARAVAAQIRELLGRNWTDKYGDDHVIGVGDIMVVAPYNDQVRLLRAHLDAIADTAGVQVGTVDKFQGRQAPVVLFTMTSSSAADMPRGMDFLFSRNRLNVAVSRAQCLAYLVCTEELLHSRAKTVEDMRLIATLCAFVEYTQP